MRSSSAITSRNEGARPVPTVDLVRDDPQPMAACNRQDRGKVGLARSPAGRVGRGVDDESTTLRGDRTGEAVEVEMPALRIHAQGDTDGTGPGDLDRPREVRPRRGRDQNFVAGPRDHPDRHHDRRHAAGRHEKALRIGRKAVDPADVPGNRLAEFGKAALVGVEGLPRSKRSRRRLADERRRRHVAFADPERDQPLAAATIVEHVDNAARRRVRGFRTQREGRPGRHRGIHLTGSFAGDRPIPPALVSHAGATSDEKRPRDPSRPVMGRLAPIDQWRA
jgi:hypothetical protein